MEKREIPMSGLKKISEIFHAARERDSAERGEFLDETCGDDQALKNEVIALLDAFEKAPGFLAQPAWVRRVDQAPEKARALEDLEPEQGLPFERLGEFRLIRRLGEGGMGVVYLAVQESLNRLVAVKAIRSERIGTFDAEARFRREVEAVSELRHPNIVTVFGSGDEKGVHYFAMEMVPGKGLDRVLRETRDRGEEIPKVRLLGWIEEIAGALDCAHRAGIIHRDVKPSNIQITPEDRAMLLDFGVARHTDLATLSLSGEFRGTPHYASPEQVASKRREIDARSDVYSLGATLYEAVTGRVPFEGETTEQIFHQILEKEPAPPRRLDASIPRDIETVILTAMDKVPERRYQTMADFAADLGRFRAGVPVLAKPAGWITKSTKWIRRHKYASLSGAATLLALAAVTVLFLFLSAQRDKELRLALAEFKPIREALDWPGYVYREEIWRWTVEADPGAPCGYMLQTLYEIDVNPGDLGKAAASLETCISKCPGRKENALEENAHYLMALIKCCMAAESSRPVEKRILLDQAASAFLQADTSDPRSKECLVLREEDWRIFSSGEARPNLQSIRINKQHHLVQLYLGLGILSELFRGGEKREFENAIGHFERVLERRPEHAAALMFLGRTYFFFARFYHFLELTDDALRCIARAAEAGGEPSSPWIKTTLAQILLLRGDNDGALEVLRKEIDPEWLQYQNILGAFGKVYARTGRYDEALEMYSRALRTGYANDVHVQVALAELHLLRGESALVFESVKQALAANERSSHPVASVYLVVARAHLERGEYDAAQVSLELAEKTARQSPRDLSLAALLMATLPEEMDLRAASVARYSSTKAGDNARFQGRLSPTCLSAQGANHFLYRRYRAAIDSLSAAIAERKRWPEISLEYYWSENARDRYFLAMAHFKLAKESEDRTGLEERARALYEEAEAEYGTKRPPAETADLIERARAKARKILGIGAPAEKRQ